MMLCCWGELVGMSFGAGMTFFCRSYCFFDYDKESDGDKAVKELHNQTLNGLRVTVQYANSDPKTPDQMVRTNTK